jgi:hypothetical protein
MEIDEELACAAGSSPAPSHQGELTPPLLLRLGRGERRPASLVSSCTH